MSASNLINLPPDLEDETTSLNSIYSPETLVKSSTTNTLSLNLTLPQTPVSLRLNFPADYPQHLPTIECTIHVDDNLPKGFGNQVLELARELLAELPPGQVILYELIEALESRLSEQLSRNELVSDGDGQAASLSAQAIATEQRFSHVPEWVLSEPLQSHKSTFLARACAVVSVAEARDAVHHLLATDKRVAKATHNMWAYRIRGAGGKAQTEIIYADAADDGEDGAGMKLAALLQSIGAWNVLLIVSRWYGGIKLGPERWRLMGNVGREALVRGGEAGLWKIEKM